MNARFVVACMLWVAFFFIASAFIVGGEPKWYGQLSSAFCAAVFATLWAVDR